MEESSSDEDALDEDLKAAHLDEWRLAEEESETSVVAAASKPSPPPSPQVSDDEGEDMLDRGVGTLVDQRQWWARRSRMTVSGRIAAWNVIIKWQDGQMITPDIMRYKPPRPLRCKKTKFLT